MLMRDDEKSRRKMFRFLVRHLLIGLGFGWFILTIFLITDVASLRSLASNSHDLPIVLPLLYLFFGITFGSAGMGIGVMSLKNDDDDNDHDGMRIMPDFNIAPRQLAPARVQSKNSRR
jgi:hypothetical protein